MGSEGLDNVVDSFTSGVIKERFSFRLYRIDSPPICTLMTELYINLDINPIKHIHKT